ncbi:hypothetical protein LIER_33302 [Lithospermum erythrorhizon]|uniref:Uncharacterized protein n=1 Tax=Lithospermum erythrorhizon TaxID=34254 RepID=A0AAV3RYI5_LITER
MSSEVDVDVLGMKAIIRPSFRIKLTRRTNFEEVRRKESYTSLLALRGSASMGYLSCHDDIVLNASSMNTSILKGRDKGIHMGFQAVNQNL